MAKFLLYRYIYCLPCSLSFPLCTGCFVRVMVRGRKSRWNWLLERVDRASITRTYRYVVHKLNQTHIFGMCH